MKDIDIANGILFQKLKIKKDTFEDRLICQKKIYLLQRLGVDLGYDYNWYLKGPYSPVLTSYIYNNLEALVSQDYSEYRLRSEVLKKVETINSLALKKNADLTVGAWYELLASLVYIEGHRKRWGLDNDATPEDIFNVLIEYKPQYSIEQCNYGYTVLKDEGFIKS